jgi:Lon protease-like protein
MTFLCEIDGELKDFSGLAPIFPLPNVVLFPNALLPLQIFEPRYRKMTADVLEGERLIAMGLIRPEAMSTPQPLIHEVMGLGKIIAHEKLKDGRYYLVLRGLARAKLLEEQQVDLPYRIGQFEICREFFHETPSFNRQDRAEQLANLYGRLFPKAQLQQLFLSSVSELPLRTVCDILLGAMPLPHIQSQRFLEELDVDARSEMLLQLLRDAVRDLGTKTSSETLKLAGRKFPPEFSEN